MNFVRRNSSVRTKAVRLGLVDPQTHQNYLTLLERLRDEPLPFRDGTDCLEAATVMYRFVLGGEKPDWSEYDPGTLCHWIAFYCIIEGTMPMMPTAAELRRPF